MFRACSIVFALLSVGLTVAGPSSSLAQDTPVRLPPLDAADPVWETLVSYPPPNTPPVVPTPPGDTGGAVSPPEAVIAPPADANVSPLPGTMSPGDPFAPGNSNIPSPDQLPSGVAPGSANAPQPIVQGPWTTGIVGGGGGFGGMMGRGPLIGGNTHTSWFAPEQVAGQGATLGYEQEQIGLTVPIIKGKKGFLFANGHIASTEIQTTAILPTSLRAFPSALWSVGMGLGGTRRFDNGWSLMANVTLGSASDRPFTGNTATVGLMTALRIPRGERNAWLFSLMYSNNSPLPFPIPGIAYAWSPSPQLFMMIGLPPSVVWRPTKKLVFEAMYMPPFRAHTRATYIISPTWRVSGGYDWENQTWFLANRAVLADRFYYFDERVSVGVQHMLGPHWVFDISSGYVFNRYFYQSSSSSGTQIDRVNVGAGPYVGMFLNARY